MAKTLDFVVELPQLTIIHQKIPGSEVGRHQHDEHEFFLPLKGEISVSHEGASVKAAPGHMLYVPPDLDHSFSSSSQGSGERVIWLVKKKAWQQQVTRKFSPASMPANSLAKELVFHLLLKPESRSISDFVSALIETLAESLESANLSSQKISPRHIGGKVTDPRIEHVIELLDQSFAELKLSDVAKKCGLSKRNLSRLFLQETGLRPIDYVMLLRMEKAKVLLKARKLTVTDVALEVGYSSLSKFISAFKKLEGVLPSDYKNRGS